MITPPSPRLSATRRLIKTNKQINKQARAEPCYERRGLRGAGPSRCGGTRVAIALPRSSASR